MTNDSYCAAFGGNLNKPFKKAHFCIIIFKIIGEADTSIIICHLSSVNYICFFDSQKGADYSAPFIISLISALPQRRRLLPRGKSMCCPCG